MDEVIVSTNRTEPEIRAEISWVVMALRLCRENRPLIAKRGENLQAQAYEHRLGQLWMEVRAAKVQAKNKPNGETPGGRYPEPGGRHQKWDWE